MENTDFIFLPSFSIENLNIHQYKRHKKRHELWKADFPNMDEYCKLNGNGQTIAEFYFGMEMNCWESDEDSNIFHCMNYRSWEYDLKIEKFEQVKTSEVSLSSSSFVNKYVFIEDPDIKEEHLYGLQSSHDHENKFWDKFGRGELIKSNLVYNKWIRPVDYCINFKDSKIRCPLGCIGCGTQLCPNGTLTKKFYYPGNGKVIQLICHKGVCKCGDLRCGYLLPKKCHHDKDRRVCYICSPYSSSFCVTTLRHISTCPNTCLCKFSNKTSNQRHNEQRRSFKRPRKTEDQLRHDREMRRICTMRKKIQQMVYDDKSQSYIEEETKKLKLQLEEDNKKDKESHIVFRRGL